MSQPAMLPNDPQLSPRALQTIAVIGFAVCVAGAAYIAFDAYRGLRTGTMHLARNPVSLSDGWRFWLNLAGELLGVALLLGCAAVMARVFHLGHLQPSKTDPDGPGSAPK